MTNVPDLRALKQAAEMATEHTLRVPVPTVLWLVERVEALEFWLRWRSEWTGASGPKDSDGVPWWRSAIDGQKPPRGFDR